MIRILFVADDVASLRDRALPLAGPLSERGWHLDALASGASSCAEFADTFGHAFEIDWGRVFFRTSRAVRDLVRREGYDLVHTVSPESGFATRKALRNVRGSSFPRMVHSATNGVPSRRDRLAARWTDDVIVTDVETSSIGLAIGYMPGHRFHLVNGLDRPLDRDRAVALVERIYGRLLGLPSNSTSAAVPQPAAPRRPTSDRSGQRGQLLECGR